MGLADAPGQGVQGAGPPPPLGQLSVPDENKATPPSQTAKPSQEATLRGGKVGGSGKSNAQGEAAAAAAPLPRQPLAPVPAAGNAQAPGAAFAPRLGVLAAAGIGFNDDEPLINTSIATSDLPPDLPLDVSPEPEPLPPTPILKKETNGPRRSRPSLNFRFASDEVLASGVEFSKVTEPAAVRLLPSLLMPYVEGIERRGPLRPLHRQLVPRWWVRMRDAASGGRGRDGLPAPAASGSGGAGGEGDGLLAMATSPPLDPPSQVLPLPAEVLKAKAVFHACCASRWGFTGNNNGPGVAASGGLHAQLAADASAFLTSATLDAALAALLSAEDQDVIVEPYYANLIACLLTGTRVMDTALRRQPPGEGAPAAAAPADDEGVTHRGLLETYIMKLEEALARLEGEAATDESSLFNPLLAALREGELRLRWLALPPGPPAPPLVLSPEGGQGTVTAAAGAALVPAPAAAATVVPAAPVLLPALPPGTNLAQAAARAASGAAAHPSLLRGSPGVSQRTGTSPSNPPASTAVLLAADPSASLGSLIIGASPQQTLLLVQREAALAAEEEAEAADVAPVEIVAVAAALPAAAEVAARSAGVTTRSRSRSSSRSSASTASASGSDGSGRATATPVVPRSQASPALSTVSSSSSSSPGSNADGAAAVAAEAAAGRLAGQRRPRPTVSAAATTNAVLDDAAEEDEAIAPAAKRAPPPLTHLLAAPAPPSLQSIAASVAAMVAAAAASAAAMQDDDDEAQEEEEEEDTPLVRLAPAFATASAPSPAPSAPQPPMLAPLLALADDSPRDADLASRVSCDTCSEDAQRSPLVPVSPFQPLPSHRSVHMLPEHGVRTASPEHPLPPSLPVAAALSSTPFPHPQTQRQRQRAGTGAEQRPVIPSLLPAPAPAAPAPAPAAKKAAAKSRAKAATAPAPALLPKKAAASAPRAVGIPAAAATSAPVTATRSSKGRQQSSSGHKLDALLGFGDEDDEEDELLVSAQAMADDDVDDSAAAVPAPPPPPPPPPPAAAVVTRSTRARLAPAPAPASAPAVPINTTTAATAVPLLPPVPQVVAPQAPAVAALPPPRRLAPRPPTRDAQTSPMTREAAVADATTSPLHGLLPAPTATTAAATTGMALAAPPTAVLTFPLGGGGSGVTAAGGMGHITLNLALNIAPQPQVQPLLVAAPQLVAPPPQPQLLPAPTQLTQPLPAAPAPALAVMAAPEPTVTAPAAAVPLSPGSEALAAEVAEVMAAVVAAAATATTAAAPAGRASVATAPPVPTTTAPAPTPTPAVLDALADQPDLSLDESDFYGGLVGQGEGAGGEGRGEVAAAAAALSSLSSSGSPTATASDDSSYKPSAAATASAVAAAPGVTASVAARRGRPRKAPLAAPAASDGGAAPARRSRSRSASQSRRKATATVRASRPRPSRDTETVTLVVDGDGAPVSLTSRRGRHSRPASASTLPPSNASESNDDDLSSVQLPPRPPPFGVDAGELASFRAHWATHVHTPAWQAVEEQAAAYPTSEASKAAVRKHLKSGAAFASPLYKLGPRLLPTGVAGPLPASLSAALPFHAAPHPAAGWRAGPDFGHCLTTPESAVALDAALAALARGEALHHETLDAALTAGLTTGNAQLDAAVAIALASVRNVAASAARAAATETGHPNDADDEADLPDALAAFLERGYAQPLSTQDCLSRSSAVELLGPLVVALGDRITKAERLVVACTFRNAGFTQLAARVAGSSRLLRPLIRLVLTGGGAGSSPLPRPRLSLDALIDSAPPDFPGGPMAYFSTALQGTAGYGEADFRPSLMRLTATPANTAAAPQHELVAPHAGQPRIPLPLIQAPHPFPRASPAEAEAAAKARQAAVLAALPEDASEAHKAEALAEAWVDGIALAHTAAAAHAVYTTAADPGDAVAASDPVTLARALRWVHGPVPPGYYRHTLPIVNAGDGKAHYQEAVPLTQLGHAAAAAFAAAAGGSERGLWGRHLRTSAPQAVSASPTL